MFGKPKAPQIPHSGLPFDELVEKRRNLDLEIASRQDGEVEKLKSKVSSVCAALGISIAELFSIRGDAEPKRRKQAPRIKYRDPDQPQNTWTGKGKPPKWIQEKLDQGATKEQFQV